MPKWTDMPKWHIIGTIHSATGFDNFIRAPTEEAARARACVMAHNQAGPDFQELCIDSANPVPEPAPPPAPAPTTISDETAGILLRVLRAARQRGAWATIDEGKEVGFDPDAIPAGYYDTMEPPEGYDDQGFIGRDYAPGDLIPVYWDPDNSDAFSPENRLTLVEEMLRGLLQPQQAKGAS